MYVWDGATGALVRVIDMPQPARRVLSLRVLPQPHADAFPLLAVLCDDGVSTLLPPPFSSFSTSHN